MSQDGKRVAPKANRRERTKRVREPVRTRRTTGPGPEKTEYETSSSGGTQLRENKGCMGALLYFALVIGISTILAGFCWVAINDVLALNKEEDTAIIVVEDDDSMGEIASQLKQEGMIQYKFLFQLYCGFSSAREKITSGTYELNTTMDYRAIVAAMGQSSSSRMTVSVTIPEGYTLEQTFRYMEEKGVNTYDALMEMAANYDYNFSFLQDLPLGEATRLEGYLFPDTYTFYLGEDPKTAINKMLVNFDAKVTDEMRDQAVEMGYSLHDIIIIASMIEKETTGEDQKTIASVIYNRLNSSNFDCIQIDATVQYALDERKENLSLEDLEVDSPYNTYLYEGLPIGPIANPGMDAIDAALNPERTNYYYYALGTDGDHHFFRTYQEHQAFVDALPDE